MRRLLGVSALQRYGPLRENLARTGRGICDEHEPVIESCKDEKEVERNWKKLDWPQVLTLSQEPY
jgi:hypothetical protein